jgi:hypothetical protein
MFRDRRVPPIALGLGAAAAYLLLRSRDYTAVDGALRCLAIFHDPTLQFHGNNHLLYPVWVLVWSGLVRADFQDPFAFLRSIQAMNAVLAAACLVLLYRVVFVLTGHRGLALLAAGFVGVSRAFVLHATQSAEPIPGLFFSLLGVALVLEAVRRRRAVLLILTGVAFALASASYQSMLLAAPLAAWLAMRGCTVREAAGRLAILASSGAVAVTIIYGFAYTWQGIPFAEMPGRFFGLGEGYEVYGGFSVSRVVNVPFGFLRNVLSAVPDDYMGIRSLTTRPDRARWVLLAAGGLALAAVVGALAIRTIRPGERWRAAVVVLGVTPILFPLLYWEPLYDKLWLQPIAFLAAALALAAGRSGRALHVGIGLIVLAAAAGAIPRAATSAVRETPHLTSAREVAAVVRPGDAVVIDFDAVSTLWIAVFGHGTEILLLPGATRPDAEAWLAKARTGNLFFLGVLDQTRKTWEAFLGRRVGIPYEVFDPYRRRATIVRTFPYEGSSITLRVMPGPRPAE